MDHNLLQKLKEWRKTTADAEGVEAFRVFPNSVLDAIAEFKPVDKDGLFAIKGIRERKYDKYGADLLALIHGSNGTGVAKIPLNNVTEERVGNDPLSVSDYLDLLNVQMRSCSARIQGEISSLDIRERVLYFSLKDSTDGSIINCIMWKNAYDLSGVAFEIGLEVILEGAPDIYKPSGRLSFKALSAELVGEGKLKKAYEELKARLDKEGLFAPERKRALPIFPTKIGLITSKNGAVIGDFQTNLGRYGFHISMIDSRVEGQLAVSELLDAIRTLKKREIEVLVIIRGGGSLESLLPFNNEVLVREIADFPVPVLAGVGHDKDVPLLCLAADKTVSTPTATAQALNDSWQRAATKVELNQRKIFASFKDSLGGQKDFVRRSFERMREHVRIVLDDFKRAEQSLQRIFVSISARISELRRIVDGYNVITWRGMRGLMSRTRMHVSAIMRSSFETIGHRIGDAQLGIRSLEKLLVTNNPERQLRLGYSIVRGRSGIVRNVAQVAQGDEIVVRVQDGSFASEVTTITKSE